MRLKCEIVANSDVEHLQQIYAGFALLHQSGFLELKQTIPTEFLTNKADPNRWVDFNFYTTKVILNNRIVVLYDTHDKSSIDEDVLREVDFYFKRSYDPVYISTLANRERIFRLGLNYPVSTSTRDFFKLDRSRFYSGNAKLAVIVKSLKIAESFGKAGETEQILNLAAPPAFELEPKLLFMTKAWNTARIEDKSQKDEVDDLNEKRADCVRILKKQFGKQFFGGLARDEFSARHFRDFLLPEVDLSNKRNYLETLKSFPICVATAGLNGSNGWKLGEYVALSKAILSEPLRYETTGDFCAGKNYLEFTNPDELVGAASRLFDDKDLRISLMTNNYRYYQSYLRPDSLILNSLETVFRKTH